MTSFLRDLDPLDPAASPLLAHLTGLAPVRVHVSKDEVVLDDSLRYVERAVAAGVEARANVWKGMIHGFLSGIGMLEASTQALEAISAFLKEQFATTAIRSL